MRALSVFVYNNDSASEVTHDQKKQLSKARSMLSEWRRALKEGDLIDILQRGEWFNAKILNRENDSLSIHYSGWSVTHDETVDMKTREIYFPFSFAKMRAKATRKPKVSSSDLIEASTIIPEVKEDDLIYSISKTGRKIKPVPSAHHVTAVKENKRGRRHKSESENGGADKNDWVCSICRHMETADESDLVLCDGACMRSFHLSCLSSQGVLAADLAADSWKCIECVNNRHTCYYCGEEGADEQEVKCCHAVNCGKFYHYSCLMTHGLFYEPLKRVSILLFFDD